MKKGSTLSKIITKIDTSRGAPIGRANVGTRPVTITSGRTCKVVLSNQVSIFDSRVELNEGYDSGGAYWGIGSELRVSYTKDLTYIEFYRADGNFKYGRKTTKNDFR